MDLQKQNLKSKNEGNRPAYAESDHIFNSIYQEYYSFLVTQARNIVGNCRGEEDIVQDTFIRFWHMRNRFEHVKNIRSFLHRMVCNESIDALRRRKIKKEYFHHTITTQCSSKNFTQEMSDLLRSKKTLQRAIERLSPQRKKIFILGKLEGYSRKQIARALNVSEITVRESMRLAVQSVRKYMQAHTDLPINDWKKPRIKKTGRLWAEETRKVA